MSCNFAPRLDVVNPCSRKLFSHEVSAVFHLLHCNLTAILDVRYILDMVIVPSLVMHEAVVIRVWSCCPAIRLDHGDNNMACV
eukprot:10566233-Lingulodinium_polyedra.AAC.1